VRGRGLKRERKEGICRNEPLILLIYALEIARSRGALAWELKLASTLAGFDDSGRARERLREIMNRISEGFGTRDYREAVAMLGQ
jgi:hypothetical protein